MKKLFLLLVCAILAMGARAQFSGSGNGTEADPYRIYTDIHLAQMANFLNQEGVVFELMKDVDLSSYIMENSPTQGWTPIGVESAPFKGILKGNGHTISGLMINRPNNDNIGLFGYIQGATIKGVTLKGKSITGRYYIGSIVGNAWGECDIEDCNIEMSGTITGLCDIGGIIGYTHDDSSFKNCHVKANITSKGSADLGSGSVGGLGGTVENAVVQNCSFEGNVSGKTNRAGGLFGNMGGVTVTDVTGKGEVSGDSWVGGIAGAASSTNTFTDVTFTGSIKGAGCIAGGIGILNLASYNTFTNVHHKGTITNTGDYTGGIVGKSLGGCIAEMESCSHFGDITGNNYVGGVVGAILNQNDQPPLSQCVYCGEGGIFNGDTRFPKLSNCLSIANITGKNWVGGLMGAEETANSYRSEDVRHYHNTSYYYWKRYYKDIVSTDITNSYYSGSISGNDNVGGIAGYKEAGYITNCYSYATIAGRSNVGGIAGTATGSVASNSSFELILKSNVAINSNISASSSNVGRIFGSRGNGVTIGALGSMQSNRALTQTSVILCGVAQDIVDDEQNGTSVGPSMLKLKGNYVSWGWNFNDDWNILETESFPYKKYQAAPPVIKSTLESHDTSISGQSLNGGTVYLYYRDREAVSTTCNGNDWVFETDALQSGAQVQLYADVESMTPSYFASATVKYPGSGTEDDPWRIYTAEDLQGAINSGYYKVMNNINLTSWINENSPIKGWPAVGRNSSVPTFIDGDGHKISGLWIDTDENYNGLFSNYSAGYIKNLNVEVAEGKKVKGGDYTGILIGRIANGQIINCSVKGEVEAGDYAGGLAGYALNAELTNSHFVGSLTGKGEYVGGLTAQSDNSSITLCSASGTVSSTNTGDTKVGGLVGATLNGGTLSKSFANTSVTANGTGECGGLVGHNEAIMAESYSEGTVTSSGEYTGGLIGLGGNVSNCYSTANVNGGGLYTAGLVGYTYGSIDKCYASGDVNGVRYGAGLVGELDGPSAKVTNSVAANNIVNLTDQSAWGCRVIGGYKNDAAEPTMRSNFALSTMQVSLNNVPQKKTDDNIEGVARTAEELMSESIYKGLGWEMTNVWAIEEGTGYPTLRQSAESPSFPGGDDTGNGGEDIDSPTNNILETDISKIANVVYTSRLTVKMGNDFVLPIKMKSEKEEIVGFQCDIYLPSCVRLEMNARGNVKAPTFNAEANRTSLDYHTISAATQPDGSVRVLCYSTENELIIGTDGTVCDFNATLAADAQPGEYAIKFKNITMTTAASVKYKVSEATFALCVPSYVKGDANGDQEIDVADISTTANHILGNEAENFVKEAADMDDDDVIDVADIAGIANLILYGDQASVKGQNKVATRAAATPSLGVASFKVESGATTASPTLNLSNAGYEFCGFQCDMYFPDGISWAKNSRGKLSAPTFNAEADRTSSEYHTVSAALQADGAVRILCYSNENEIFLGEDGAILNLPITFDGNLVDGTYEVAIKNIVLTTPAASKITPAETSFGITIGNPSVEIALTDGSAYTNTASQQVSKLTYTRTFNNTNWQPLYVPFSMQYSDWASQGLEVARLNGFYEYDDNKDGKINRSALEVLMVTEGEGALIPNHPYMIRANATGTKDIVVNNTTLYPAEENVGDCSTFETKYSFTGTYGTMTQSELAAMGAYIMGGGTLTPSAGALRPMRWYMTRESRGGQLLPVLKEIKVFVQGEEDALDFVNAESEEGATYNLMGQKVNREAKGITIRNGRKYVR